MTRAFKVDPAGEQRKDNLFDRIFPPRRQAAGNPASLYGAIVAQAREPDLYTEIGVPDTVDGRFEMVLLHTILVIRRLRSGDPDAVAAGQGVFDLFCTDMDRSLREMGVGDLAVPKRMRKIGESYYGRAAAYEEPLVAGDAVALAAALARNVWPEEAPQPGNAWLARYALAVAASLAESDPAVLASGSVSFPQVRRFTRTEVTG